MGATKEPSRRVLQQLSIIPSQTVARPPSSACQSNRTRLGKGRARRREGKGDLAWSRCESERGSELRKSQSCLQGFLVQLPAPDDDLPAQPTRIIFDPIWSPRASPLSIAGPKRRLQPPCELNQLPEFHFVVTSHNQSVYPDPATLPLHEGY